jgi:DNA repair photolyase
MDQEQSWITVQTIGDDDNTAATNYSYFMRPEPRENLGPIRLEYDEWFGREVKVRDLSIGMTRNAKKENRKIVKAYLEPYPHMRIDKAKPLQGWYKGLHEPKGVRARPCFTEAVLTQPYGGWCAVGCAFCYVNSGFRGYRGTGLITVPLNYGEQIRSQLRKIRRGAAVYFSSSTDPFIPLEEVYHNTEEAAKACVEVGLPIFFLSRLRYPQWAVDLLKQNKHSYAQKSINTPDPEDWRRMSPGALSLNGHFNDIRRLKRNGIYVSIQVNPVIPGVTSNSQIVELFKLLAKAGADHVIVKFVEAGYSWAPAMAERMIKRYGDRGRAFADLFQENIGGQRTIVEDYRMRAHKVYSSAAKRYGMTYATCYEYQYLRDSSRNVLDKTGESIGRKFTTAAQCHGHAVPVYTRINEGEKFRPVKECPPSGCLYCASENDGVPRCGDKLAGEAMALKLIQLTIPVKRNN